MVSIGPYTFSPTDAARTVANADVLWAQLVPGADDAALVEDLRPQVTGDVDADLPVVWAALQAVGPALRAAGRLPTGEGLVAQLNTSDGGVPKRPVTEVEVDWTGVVGDRQRNRNHHGRPWQALCLWSAEVIGAFAADGHPIAPGAAGENVTVTGLDWTAVRPGGRLRLGAVVAELSAWAVPCRHNAPWFADGDFNRMHHDRGPVSRIYATVLEPGTIRTGDPVLLD